MSKPSLEERFRDMGEATHKVMTENICCSSREAITTTIRSKARKLREHSIQLDRLADELSRFSFSQDADEALWRELVSKQF